MRPRSPATWLLVFGAFACTRAPGADTQPPPSNPPPPPPTPQVFEPGPSAVPRLTATQYRNTIVDLFGDALPDTPVEPDTNPYLFYSIGAATTSLSEPGAVKYADAADAILDAVEIDEAFMGCSASAADDGCVRSFLARFGRRLYRRPLMTVELDQWSAVSRDTADGDWRRGVQHALFGMLQSPAFLYRAELGEPDPADSTRLRYTSVEMASRLSFLLWNTSPDEALLDAAEAGALVTDEGLEREITRMLESPRMRASVQDFFAQYFDLGRLDQVELDPVDYPLYSEALIEAMRQEVRLLVDDIVFRHEADVRTIFSTRRTFVNSELAALYGVEAPGASSIAYVPVELPADGPRAGLLTLGAFLAMNAHPSETSPTLRGKYVKERVLCQTVTPPPDDVDTQLNPENGEARTLRERLEQHREDPACAGCHAAIDPPGFLFEGFDSLGVHRTEVDGYPLDTTGDLDGRPLADAKELALVLKEDPQVSICIVRQLYRHANARLDEQSERPAIRALHTQFAEDGYRFGSLLRALVLSEGFRTLRRTP